MRVLLAQLCPAAGAPESNARRLADVLAAHPQAELAVFPELFLTGYDLGAVGALETSPLSPALRTAAQAAAEHRTPLVVGAAEVTPEGPANTLFVFDEGGSLGARYRKVLLFGDERTAFVAGEAFVIAGVAGARAGLLNCFDMEFPEPVRALARAGADLLVTASANMEPYGADHDLASRARALDNRLPHVYVNRVGEQAGLRFTGRSRSIAPDGTVLAEAPADEEAVLITDVTPGPAPDDLVHHPALAPEAVPVHVHDPVPGGGT
jgi:predicted amidohydrolase